MQEMTKAFSREEFENRLFSRLRPADSGCLEWTGARGKHGYGNVRFAGKTYRVHRVVYELLVGPIPDGLTLDHLCRNKLCAAPGHLEPVTLDVNILRSTGMSARNASKTHCNLGHSLDGDNVALSRYGDRKYARRCKRCAAASAQRVRDKKKAVSQ